MTVYNGNTIHRLLLKSNDSNYINRRIQNLNKPPVVLENLKSGIQRCNGAFILRTILLRLMVIEILQPSKIKKKNARQFHK